MTSPRTGTNEPADNDGPGGSSGTAGAAEPLSSRERLIDAAIHIAGTEGQDRVTYRSVAARAGVAHGLVRFHFGTRESLLTEAFQRAARRDAADARLLTDDLDAFGSDLVRTISDGAGRQILQYDFVLRALRGGAPIEQVVALYDFYLEQVAGTLENLELDDPDGSLAAMVFATLDGLVLQHSIYADPDRTERVLVRLRHVLRLAQAAEGPGKAAD